MTVLLSIPMVALVSSPAQAEGPNLVTLKLKWDGTGGKKANQRCGEWELRLRKFVVSVPVYASERMSINYRDRRMKSREAVYNKDQTRTLYFDRYPAGQLKLGRPRSTVVVVQVLKRHADTARILRVTKRCVPMGG